MTATLLLVVLGALPDPYMGDWKGTLTTPNGVEATVYAQVIALGREGYRARLLSALDRRVEPLAVLAGRAVEGGIDFGAQGRIVGDVFTGALADPERSFELHPFERLSPTLGLAPPAGAIVLFDGRDLSAWEQGGDRSWTVNLATLLGGDNRAAYLRATVISPRSQPARLELGSDDGVKAWVNGALVHANMVMRPLRAWEDRAEIELREGENTVLLKVVQGAGGWEACARIRGRDGTDLSDLRFGPAPVVPDDTTLRSLQGESAGTILTWELAGPYEIEGRGPADLFDHVFPPEVGGEAEWRVVNQQPRPMRTWRITDDGACEVTPGSGSLFTSRAFGDFTLHLEFRTPFMPDARGQGRGNSGVFMPLGYEIQVLDSYGLEGRDNECGGIYTLAAPAVNACAPPGQWQTYDVEYTAAKYDAAVGRVTPARITVRHNGLLIHDDLELPLRGGGGPGWVGRGNLLLQDHGNPVQYRNIWIVER